MKHDKVIALLPMKGHSERVPGKNFRDLCGKPLCQWILDSLLAVTRIAQVVINTDARAELARHGIVDTERVLIRDRAPVLCGDMVSMNLVLRDDVMAVPGDLYLMTHATNPLLSSDTVRRCLEAFEANPAADSLFTVNRVQTRFYRGDGSPVNHDPNDLVRTQDLEPWFEENSCLYLFTRDSFTRTDARIGESPMLFETPPLESLDIDDETDWTVTEALLRASAR